MKNSRTVIIHHSVTGHNVATSTIKNWGYDFVIRWDGSIIRAKGNAHTYGQNQHWGICLIGNFEKEKPNPKQLSSLSKKIKELRISNITGHRDWRNNPRGHNFTACPGKNLYKLIPTIKKEVGVNMSTIQHMVKLRNQWRTKARTFEAKYNKYYKACKKKLLAKNKLILKYQEEKKLNAQYLKELERDMAKIVAENQRQSKRIITLEKRLNNEAMSIIDKIKALLGIKE